MGTLAGALIVGVLGNIMNLIGIGSYIQQIVIGAIIVVAVAYDVFSKRGKAKATILKSGSKNDGPAVPVGAGARSPAAVPFSGPRDRHTLPSPVVDCAGRNPDRMSIRSMAPSFSPPTVSTPRCVKTRDFFVAQGRVALHRMTSPKSISPCALVSPPRVSGSRTTYRPRGELAVKVSAATHDGFNCGCLPPWYLNCREACGWMKTVVRPPPVDMSSFHVKVNASPRRTFVTMTTCRCASSLSSKSVFVEES